MSNTAEDMVETPTPNYTLKVSPKGAVSLYGVRKLPVTFYKDEWEAILAQADQVRQFIEENGDKLSAKE